MSTSAFDGSACEMARVILDELDHCDRHFEKQRTRRELLVNRATEETVLPALQAEEATRTALHQAPFVVYARALVNGKPAIRLICRQSIPDHDPKTQNCEFVSYLAPMGRLAAQPVGQATAIQVPAGRMQVTLVEKNQFRSVRRDGWDAVNNVFTSLANGVLHIESLRAVLAAAPTAERAVETAALEGRDEQPEAIIDAPTSVAEREDEERRLLEKLIEAALRKSESHNEAVSRAQAAQARAAQGVVQAFELRDQAILDTIQDEVFRLPLSSRVAVTGAPGTGKTTVLIKRIAQKTFQHGLTDEEKRGLTEQQLKLLLDRQRSWVLFTPNDLLRNYVKEALGKEHLPATQRTVVTWSDKRTRLARDVFRILRVGSRGVFKRSAETFVALGDPASVDDYLTAFRHFWRDHTSERLAARWKLLAAAARVRDETPRPGLHERGRSAQPFSALWDAMGTVLSAMEHVRTRGGMRPIEVATLGAGQRDPFREASRALDAFVAQATIEVGLKFPVSLARQHPEETLESATTRLERALLASRVNIDDEEREPADGTAAPEHHDVLDVVADPALRQRIEAARVWNAALRSVDRLTSGYDALFTETIATYRHFRGALRRDELPVSRLLTLQARRGDADGLLGDEELDLLLIVLLRLSDSLFERNPSLLWSDHVSGTLKRVREELRTVVTVDEATDFSWMQLGCMYYLAHPAVRAFSMSGDLMQRVTHHGLRHWDECRRFADDIQVRELRLVYRQSRALLRVAASLYRLAMNEEPPFDSPLPTRLEPQPLLAQTADLDTAAHWVAERIVEIYVICGLLPSIGVFVPEERQVGPVATLLRDALADHAIEVEGCEHGKVLGTGDRVRVFSVEHIKGLEFHGVFLVDFDQLQRWDAELADKYLYVGLTRAAEFLGVTVREALPPQIRSLSEQFGAGTWQEFGRGEETSRDEA